MRRNHPTTIRCEVRHSHQGVIEVKAVNFFPAFEIAYAKLPSLVTRNSNDPTLKDLLFFV